MLTTTLTAKIWIYIWIKYQTQQQQIHAQPMVTFGKLQTEKRQTA